MLSKEQYAWLRLSQTERVGAVTFKKLIEFYGTAQAALDQLGELSQRGGRKQPLIAASTDRIDAIIAEAEAQDVHIICSCDLAYPNMLRQIHDAPAVLFARGQDAVLNRLSVGIVGARNASINGQNFAKKMAADLGRAGVLSISGLARGIDTVVHQGSLETGTIAVLGGGIDHIYPPENDKLYRRIMETGCIISEYPVGMVPKAQHFPRRNRIISGISSALLVVEAAKKSGSLITARLAAEQGRDVLAVPGSPLDPRCHGTNGLIKQGAALVEHVDDVLEVLAAVSDTVPAPQASLLEDKQPLHNPLEENQAIEEWRGKILEALSPTPVAVTEIMETLYAPARIVHLVLLELYLAGRIEHHAGGKVSLVYDV